MVVSLFKQMTTLVKASTLEFQNSIFPERAERGTCTLSQALCTGTRVMVKPGLCLDKHFITHTGAFFSPNQTFQPQGSCFTCTMYLLLGPPLKPLKLEL